MAGALTPEQFQYLETKVLEAAVPELVALDAISVNRNIPASAQEIARDRVAEITKNAKVISKRGDYERVTLGKTRKVSYIFQIGLGFSIAERDILSGQAGGGEPLPTLNARKVSRKVAEKVDSLIFNGESRLDVPGIYANAGQTYTETKPWNSAIADPYDSVNLAIEKLDDYEFKPKVLVCGKKVLTQMRKKDINGNRYIDQVADLLPGGTGSIIQSKTITEGTALLCDAGPDIAECYLQEDINLRTFPLNSNEVQDFNIRTKLGVDLHESKAFVKMVNLVV